MRQIGNPSSYQKSRSHLFVLLSGCVMTVAVWSCFAALLLVTGCTAPLPADSRSVGQPSGLEKIRHVIVIYQENWSFDGLYGKFPGADGIANAGERIRQVKQDGTSYTTLPQPLDTSRQPPVPDPRFPANLPVAPYDAAQYVPADQKTGDIVNLALQQERQINGGRMDGFVAWSENGGLAMSYYDATNLPVGRLAQQYTLADRFFHSAFDGSLFNHFWLVCACTPQWPDAPANLRIGLDAQGNVVKDGSVTPDGYVVGWKDAAAGHPDPSFQFHHQPFNYFAVYSEGAAARDEHLKDAEDFLAALSAGTLPAFSFGKPMGSKNEHLGYATLLEGQEYVA